MSVQLEYLNLVTVLLEYIDCPFFQNAIYNIMISGIMLKIIQA